MPTFKQIADRLNQNPLFHMSLGSKELFHSNYLAWLTWKYPEASRAALEPWCVALPDQPGHRTLREHRHLDLVEQMAGLAPLIIENKMFSLPDEAQFDRYAAESSKEFPSPRSLV